MPEWLPAVLALFLGSSVLVALITAPLAHRVGMRTARAQEVTAQAATTTAEVAGRTAAVAMLDAHTREWSAMFQTAQNLATTASAQADKVKADLAAVTAIHQRDMLTVTQQLIASQQEVAEYRALYQGLIDRVADVQAEQHSTTGRLETLEREQNGG